MLGNHCRLEKNRVKEAKKNKKIKKKLDSAHGNH
jgi:hypothetical protein